MDGSPGPTTWCGAALDDIRAAAVARHQPDLVVALDGGDGHRDHLRIRAVVEQVVAETATPVYLHALPRSLMHAWVRHNAGDADAAAYTELSDIGTPDEDVTTVVDTATHLERREAAIAVHRSQRSPFDGLPDDLRRASLGRGHLVRVNPPWTGGLFEHQLPRPGDGPSTGFAS